MATRWIAGRRRPERDPELRLFCFSHAGGGSSLFSRWRGRFGAAVEVCPVLLPGREARMHEACFRRVEELVEPVVAALLPEMDRPFALFGHSLGSVIAFEVARRVMSEDRRPEVLFVSGRRAPHLRARRAPVHGLDEPQFLAAIGRLNGTPDDVLKDPVLMQSFLPCLRADFELNETYAPLTGWSLGCDIEAFMGDADPEVTEDELVAWREVTAGGFRHHVMRGDHFYLLPTPDGLLEKIGSRLGYPLSAGGTSERVRPSA